MTPQELPACLEALKAKVEAAAVPVCDAMAEKYETHLKDVTLVRSGSHAPMTSTPAPRGAPPAMMSDPKDGPSLRDSVERVPAAGSGGYAEASVAPHTVYAAVQEDGAVITAKSGPYMWLWIYYLKSTAGWREVIRRNWLREEVTIPARPYMLPTTEETVASGELTRAAEAAFEAAVWGG